MTDNIHLGLDLKGGTHLVLEVHVEEAVASATDRDVARLETALPEGGHHGRDGGQDGPGASGDDCGLGDSCGEAERCARRSCRAPTTRTTTWATLPDGSATLTMKQAAISDLEARTLETSIETIQRARQHAGRDRAGDRRSTGWARTRFWWSCRASSNPGAGARR